MFCSYFCLLYPLRTYRFVRLYANLALTDDDIPLLTHNVSEGMAGAVICSHRILLLHWYMAGFCTLYAYISLKVVFCTTLTYSYQCFACEHWRQVTHEYFEKFSFLSLK